MRRNGGEVFIDETARTLTSSASGLADLTRIAGWFDESGITVDDIGLARPSLDDVFLSLTGHRAETTDDDPDADNATDNATPTSSGDIR
ncbi:daunorubicin resistance ABC transporter ATP-binding subunit [Mycobacteroides abscessus subsp. abscessus]|nr:daunorubicin resistance ABC transporter ATP-binding subunit [Mycobacteroides abscessus subsp. abscessus]